jgi:hypothetical protein
MILIDAQTLWMWTHLAFMKVGLHSRGALHLRQGIVHIRYLHLHLLILTDGILWAIGVIGNTRTGLVGGVQLMMNIEDLRLGTGKPLTGTAWSAVFYLLGILAGTARNVNDGPLFQILLLLARSMALSNAL